MRINHSFQINFLLEVIPPHFLENYFAEVNIKNDHMIDKMEDRVKHGVNKYDDVLFMRLKTVMMVL